jgi:Protein of unknown function (DUF3365)
MLSKHRFGTAPSKNLWLLPILVFCVFSLGQDKTRLAIAAPMLIQESAPAKTVQSEIIDSTTSTAASSGDDAIARARLLHETIKGALLVVHRDFFDDENPHVLPSQSLEDVFEELARSQGVQLRWLTVDADEMNIHHRPQNKFEEQAIGKLKTGAEQHSILENEQLQYVGRIPLANQCLKCHVKQRLNLNERAAGLSIVIPVVPARHPK